MDRGQRLRNTDTVFEVKEEGWVHDLVEANSGLNVKLSDYFLAVPRLRHEVNDLTQKSAKVCDNKRLLALIQKCQSLERNLKSWQASIPKTWLHTVVGQAPDVKDDVSYVSSELCPGLPVYRYDDPWIALFLNCVRTTHMFINAFIIRCLQHAGLHESPEHRPAYQIAIANLQQMVNEVCSSIPYHIGFYPRGPCPIPSMNYVDPVALAAYFHLWPVYVARSAVCTPKRQRDWLRQRLDVIAKRFGSHNATSLAKVGDAEEGRPLFIGRWNSDMYENVLEACTLYAACGV